MGSGKGQAKRVKQYKESKYNADRKEFDELIYQLTNFDLEFSIYLDYSRYTDHPGDEGLFNDNIIKYYLGEDSSKDYTRDNLTYVLTECLRDVMENIVVRSVPGGDKVDAEDVMRSIDFNKVSISFEEEIEELHGDKVICGYFCIKYGDYYERIVNHYNWLHPELDTPYDPYMISKKELDDGYRLPLNKFFNHTYIISTIEYILKETFFKNIVDVYQQLPEYN